MAQRPIKGETWYPNTTEYRRFQRVADDFDRAVFAIGLPPVAVRLGPGVCRVRNNSGDSVGRFGILGIDGAWMEPSESDEGARFCNELPLDGNAPAIESHDGKFVVLMEPAADGDVAWCINSGIAPVQIEVTGGLQWYEYADVKDGNTSVLTLLPSGASQVLYPEESSRLSLESGVHWAIVRLGLPLGNVRARVVLDDELSAGGTATASFWGGSPMADTGNDAEVSDGDENWSMMAEGDDPFPSGTKAIVGWYPDSRTWQLENAACSNTSE